MRVAALGARWGLSAALVGLAAVVACLSLDLHNQHGHTVLPGTVSSRMNDWLSLQSSALTSDWSSPSRVLEPALHPDRISVVLFTRRHPHHLHTLLPDLEAHPSVGEVLVWDASDGSARVDRLSSARVRVFAGTWGSWASVGEAWSAEAHPPLLFALAGVSSFPRVLLLDDRWGRVPGSVLESLEGRSRGSVWSVHGLFGWSLCAEGSSSSSTSSSSSPPSPSSPWSSYPSLVVSPLSPSSSSSSSVSLVSLYGLLFRREYVGAMLEVRPLVSSWFLGDQEQDASVHHPGGVQRDEPVSSRVSLFSNKHHSPRSPSPTPSATPTVSPSPHPIRPVEDWFDHPVDRALFAWTARRLGGVGALVIHTDLGDAWTRMAKSADGAPGPTWSGPIPGWWGWVVLWELGLGVFGCEVREDEASWRARASTRALWPTPSASPTPSPRINAPAADSNRHDNEGRGGFVEGDEDEDDDDDDEGTDDVGYPVVTPDPAIVGPLEHRLPLFDRRRFARHPATPGGVDVGVPIDDDPRDQVSSLQRFFASWRTALQNAQRLHASPSPRAPSTADEANGRSESE